MTGAGDPRPGHVPRAGTEPAAGEGGPGRGARGRAGCTGWGSVGVSARSAVCRWLWCRKGVPGAARGFGEVGSVLGPWDRELTGAAAPPLPRRKPPGAAPAGSAGRGFYFPFLLKR